MKIGIDARFYGPQHAGLGRYTKNLVDWILKLDQNNEYVLFASPDNIDLITIPESAKAIKVLVQANHYSIKEQLELPKVLGSYNLDLVHFPHLNVPLAYRGRFVVTIHDLIMHTFKNRAVTTRIKPVYELKHLGYRAVTRWAATRADRVIVPSQTVKQEILDFYKLPQAKVVVTLEAADDKTFERQIKAKDVEAVRQKYGLKGKFIMYVGNVYPHKNISTLAKAMKALGAEHNLQLILPSARGVFLQRTEEMMQQEGVRSFVVLPGFVPDDELSILYQAAEAYVFPTLAEGFGLPPLEAMASGLPVICSDIPVLHEVCGSAALYFDPLDEQQIVEQVMKLMTEVGLRQRLIKSGLEQAKKFSWKKMAEETLAVYLERKS